MMILIVSWLIFVMIMVLITFGDDGNCGRDTTATASVRADGNVIRNDSNSDNDITNNDCNGNNDTKI